MSHRIQEEQEFAVMGIAARVSNATPELIGDLWRRFHAMGDAQIIPTRLSDVVYCVYCEYEGDFTQPYTVLIGCAVPDDAAPHESLKKVKVAGRFAAFPVTGELPQAMIETWSSVWTMPLDRRYGADFDQYKTDGTVTVHVGVR